MSPYDFLPDFLIPVGWFDDAFLLGILVYYLRRGKVPGFISSLGRLLLGDRRASNRHDRDSDGGDWDPYEILGVNPRASDEEIRIAYRQAAPELRELARQKFLEIHKAYEYLQNRSDS
ncbi:MAG: DnaJ domain-containing protein [Deltaproteobacteria bacterium]|nr:DnaJ domain-containing protein [Deltaproteobacteria bacterium]